MNRSPSEIRNKVLAQIDELKAIGINMRLHSDTILSVNFRITQEKLIEGQILSEEDLYKRAHKICEPLEQYVKVLYETDQWDGIEVNNIDSQWVNAKQQYFEVTTQTMEKELNLDGDVITRLYANNLQPYDQERFFEYFMEKQFIKPIQMVLRGPFFTELPPEIQPAAVFPAKKK